MKTNNKNAAPAEPNNTTTTTEPCIFTPADRKRLKKLLSKESFEELMELKEADPMPEQLFDSDGEEIDDWSMDEIAIKSWHDGGHLYIYQLGRRVYAFYDDFDESLMFVENDVRDVIEYYVSRYGGCLEEYCVCFGVKPDLRFAKRGSNELCRVWIKTFYTDSDSAHGDSPRWARDDNREIILFDSYSDARKWINQDKKRYYTNGMYHVRNNEYDYRQYKICE